MIDLKQYIEESLLDDFETLNNKISNDLLDKPLTYFHQIFNNTNDWNAARDQLLLLLKTSDAEELLKFKKPMRGHVTLCIIDQKFADAQDSVFLYLNKKDVSIPTIPPNRHGDHPHWFTIYPNPTQNNRPTFSFIMNWGRE